MRDSKSRKTPHVDDSNGAVLLLNKAKVEGWTESEVEKKDRDRMPR